MVKHNSCAAKIFQVAHSTFSNMKGVIDPILWNDTTFQIIVLSTESKLKFIYSVKYEQPYTQNWWLRAYLYNKYMSVQSFEKHSNHHNCKQMLPVCFPHTCAFFLTSWTYYLLNAILIFHLLLQPFLNLIIVQHPAELSVCNLFFFYTILSARDLPVSMACASLVFHWSATSLARGSSGFGALSSACIESNTVRIWRAGLHLSEKAYVNFTVNRKCCISNMHKRCVITFKVYWWLPFNTSVHHRNTVFAFLQFLLTALWGASDSNSKRPLNIFIFETY